MKDFLLNLLFKRNYFDRAVYVSVIFLIGSVASLASKNSWIVFFDGLVSKNEQNEIYVVLIGIVKTLLIAGSWPAVIVSFFLVAALLLVRYRIATGSASIEDHFRDEFDFIASEIDAFQFRSAFRRLEKLERQFKSSRLLKIAKTLNSQLHFLKGEASSWISEVGDQWSFYIRAYELEKENISYKERYCTTLLHQNDPRALSVANEIIKETELSGRAWAVKLLTEDNTSHTIATIPTGVKADIQFIRIYSANLLKQGRYDEADEILDKAIKAHQSDKISVDRTNVFYFNLIAGHCFEKVLRELRYPLFESIEVQENDNLDLAVRLFDATLQTMANTDCKDSELFIKTDFYYSLGLYFQKPTRKRALEIGEKYLKGISTIGNQNIISFIVAPFLQNGLNEEAIKLCDELSHYRRHFFKSLAFRQKGDDKKTVDSIRDYFIELENIDPIDFEFLTFSFSILHSLSASSSILYSNHLAQKDFFSKKHKEVLEVFANLFNKEFNFDIDAFQIGLDLEQFENDPNTIKIIVEILFHFKRFEKCISIIESLDHIDLGIELLRLKSLSALRRDIDTVIEGYQKLRTVHDVPYHVLIDELNHCIVAEHFPGIRDASRYGVNMFKEHVFKYYLAYALDHLEEYDELDSLLDDSIVTLDVDWQKRHDLSLLCVNRGKFQLALDISYKSTMDNFSSPLAKESYFHLCNIIENKESGYIAVNQEDELRPPSWAIVKSPKGKELILNSSDSSYTTIVGKKRGFEFKLDEFFSNGNFTLINVVSKYEGLLIRVRQEIFDADPDESPFITKTINFESIEEFVDIVVDKFGKREELRRIRIDETFKKYFRSEITFTELVVVSNPNDPLSIYKELRDNRSTWNFGVISLPLALHNKVLFEEEKLICLDITSVPLLYDLSKDHPELLKANYIISYYVVQFFDQKIKELQMIGEKEGQLHINMSGIQINKQNPGEYEEQITYLKNLSEFAKKHLNPKISFKKLEDVPEKDWLKSNWHLKYLVDTYYLAQGNIIVSDDRIFINKNGVEFVSPEYFIAHNFPNLLSQSLARMLELNYKGLAVTSDVMFNVYMNPVAPKHIINNIIENLPNRINHEPVILDEVLDFIRDIYAQGGEKQIIRRISQTFLRSVLVDYPNLFELSDSIQSKLTSRFNLLGMSIVEVIEDFSIVFDILKRERNQNRTSF